MSALGYLYLKTLKNSFRELLHNKAKLILYIFILAMLVFVLVTPSTLPQAADYAPIEQFYAIVFGFYVLIFFTSISAGFSSGASFFKLADVNLLFTAPLDSRRILSYGLLSNLFKSLLMGFVLLYQYSWLNQRYGISILLLVYALLGYGLCIFAAQFLALLIYSVSAGSDTVKKILKSIIYALLVMLGVYVLLPLLQNGKFDLALLTSRINSPFLDYAPILGWVRYGVVSLMKGDILASLKGFGVYFGALLIMIFAFVKYQSDYYEDVLVSAETNYNAQTAAKEGKLAESAPKNVKLGKTGLSGSSAGVFFYKHLVEARRARVFIIDAMGLTGIVSALLFSFFMSGAVELTSAYAVIPTLAFSTYMQMFTIGTGRWGRELLKHYVYLVPESSFKKLLGICAQTLLNSLLEAALMFAAVGLLLKLPIAVIILCVFMRSAYAFLFMSCDTLTERVFGGALPKMVELLLYMLFFIVLSAPGIIGGVVVGGFFAYSETIAVIVGLSVVVAWNVLIGLLVMFLCRNMLDYAEYMK